jgi:protein-serine/threonine kinase
VSAYDRSGQDAFLGHVRLCIRLDEKVNVIDRWYKLEPRGHGEEPVTGEIHLRIKYQKSDKKHFGPEDFQILKLIGKGKWKLGFQSWCRHQQCLWNEVNSAGELQMLVTVANI